MQTDVLVRLAEQRDADAIAELNMAMAFETEHVNLEEDSLRQGVRSVFDEPDYGFYVVAESDGQVVGCLLITFEWSDWRCGQFWYIQSLYIRPPFRRCGVFRQLHEFVKSRAANRPEVCGLRLYVEESNHTARRAYERIGMQLRSYRIYEQILPQ